jgi:multidrug transporter EmrE-like cation transporter
MPGIRGALMNLVVFLIYIATSVAGLILMKSPDSVMSLRFGLGFLLYASGFLLWLWLLRRIPLSIAFPIAAGALIAATQLAGYLVLKESISWPHAVGVGLILSGVFVLAVRGLLA